MTAPVTLEQRTNMEGRASGLMPPEMAGGRQRIHLERILSRTDRRKFLRLPWKIYAGDPLWVPPLRHEERRLINERVNPFFQYGSADLFGAYDATGVMVGRIAAIHNPSFNARHGSSAGFFGMFECVNSQEVAHSLLRAALDQLSLKGCTSLLGPVTMTPNEEVGVFIEGDGSPPMILANYAPPYYQTLFEGCGLSKAIDLLTYTGWLGHRLPAKFDRVAAAARARGEISLRPFRRESWEGEIETIRGLYNTAFVDTWGFVPMSAAEAHNMGRLLKLSDEKLVVIAEWGGKPAGCILAALDVNEILKGLNGRLFPFGGLKLLQCRRLVSSIRVMVLCVLPQFRFRGIEALLVDAVHQRMIARRYRRAEFSFVFEDNLPMRRMLEALGFVRSKCHRLYQGAVGADSGRSHGEEGGSG